jgi:UDP-glucose 4-epimerase
VGRWSYAITKSLEEAACLAYARERKLKVVVGRLFNVVGTRQSRRYGAVLPRFVEQASSDKPLTVFGSGRQVRSFLHVQDAVRCMQALLRNSRAHGKIVNIGNPGGITVFQLAKRVKYLTRSDSKIIKVDPERQYGPDFVEHPRRVPDLTRLRSLIHFKPSKTLDDAILELASEKEGAAPSAPHKKHWTRRSVSLLKRKS